MTCLPKRSGVLAFILFLGVAMLWPQAALPGLTYDPNEVLTAPVGTGVVWYVDSISGSDANNGRSEGTAFKTIGKAVMGSGAPVGPGDTVLIKAGTYRERFSIAKSGTATNRIVIGPYGNGEVVIDGSTAVAGWTLVSGQVYKASVALAPTAVVVDEQPLFPEFTESALVDGRWYFDNTTSSLYLWCPGGGDPSARNVGIVSSNQYSDAVFINNASYVTLYGVTVRYTGGRGISILGNYNRVEKCNVKFNGHNGINMYRYGTTQTTDTEIIKNHVYHNFLRNWPRGRYKWGGWGQGATSNSTPNTKFIGNISHKNGGEGIGAYGGAGGTTFKDNISYDNWSVNIYTDNQPNGRIENNFIYCREPDPNDLYNNQDPAPEDNRSLKRLRAEGIMTADENYSLTPPANLSNVVIANNVIIGCRRGIQHYGQAAGSGLKYVQVMYNTIIVPNAVGIGEDYIGINIPYNNGNNVGSVYRNNVVYASNPATYVLYGGTDPAGVKDSFNGITLSNNLWYHATRTNAWHWGRDYNTTWDYSFSGWRSLPGAAHGTGDVNADPKLVNVSTYNAQDKRFADSSSPAIGRGVDVGILYDINYFARPSTGNYDIGAFQYGSIQQTRIPFPPFQLRVQ